MTSREQFEDKYALLMGKTVTSIRDCRHESGYREREGYTMEIAWRMWQASRESIEIELPNVYGGKYTPSSITMDGFDFEEYLTDLYAAIEQANVKVKK